MGAFEPPPQPARDQQCEDGAGSVSASQDILAQSGPLGVSDRGVARSIGSICVALGGAVWDG